MSIFTGIINRKDKYPEDVKLKRKGTQRIDDALLNMAYNEGRFKNCPRDKGKTQIVKMLDW